MKSVEYGTHTDIRVAPELSFSLPATIDATNVQPDANGRKIIRAGTPVGGGDWLDDASQVLHTIDTQSTPPTVSKVTTTNKSATATLK